MYNRGKTNTIKYIINSFANGEIDRIKDIVNKQGEDIFELIPKLNSGNYSRLAVYPIKNGHFEAFRLYLNSSNPKPLSRSELYLITKHNSSKKRFKSWIENYKKYTDVQSFIEFETIFPMFLNSIISTYNEELIEEFLEMYPENYNFIVDKINTSNKGIQLKRNLKLKYLL